MFSLQFRTVGLRRRLFFARGGGVALLGDALLVLPPERDQPCIFSSLNGLASGHCHRFVSCLTRLIVFSLLKQSFCFSKRFIGIFVCPGPSRDAQRIPRFPKVEGSFFVQQ